jgi:hypothetical protein
VTEGLTFAARATTRETCEVASASLPGQPGTRSPRHLPCRAGPARHRCHSDGSDAQHFHSSHGDLSERQGVFVPGVHVPLLRSASTRLSPAELSPTSEPVFANSPAWRSSGALLDLDSVQYTSLSLPHPASARIHNVDVAYSQLVETIVLPGVIRLRSVCCSLLGSSGQLLVDVLRCARVSKPAIRPDVGALNESACATRSSLLSSVLVARCLSLWSSSTIVLPTCAKATV